MAIIKWTDDPSITGEFRRGATPYEDEILINTDTILSRTLQENKEMAVPLTVGHEIAHSKMRPIDKARESRIPGRYEPKQRFRFFGGISPWEKQKFEERQEERTEAAVSELYLREFEAVYWQHIKTGMLDWVSLNKIKERCNRELGPERTKAINKEAQDTVRDFWMSERR